MHKTSSKMFVVRNADRLLRTWKHKNLLKAQTRKNLAWSLLNDDLLWSLGFGACLKIRGFEESLL